MRYLLVIMLLLVSSCSNNPTKFILAPQAFLAPSQVLNQSQFSFKVVDNRAMSYTLRVVKEGKSYQLKTSNNVVAHIESSVSEALSQQGADLNTNSNNQVEIQIAQLQALVSQNTLDYTVTNQVALLINVKTPAGEFSKTYSGDGNFTAAFKMDVATVERELRILTEQVLSQLLQDNSWQAFLRS